MLTQEEWYMIGLAVALLVIIAFFTSSSSNFTIAMPVADGNGQINTDTLATNQDLTSTDNILQNAVYTASGGMYGSPPSAVGSGAIDAGSDSDSDAITTGGASSAMLMGGTAPSSAAGYGGGYAQIVNLEATGADNNVMQDPTTYNALGALADINSSVANTQNTAVASIIAPAGATPSTTAVGTSSFRPNYKAQAVPRRVPATSRSLMSVWRKSNMSTMGTPGTAKATYNTNAGNVGGFATVWTR